MSTEAWLSGPIEGVSPLLMPVAHSIVQSKRDLRAAASGLTARELTERPGGAASAGFHLRHIAGSADRLLTYALDRPLSQEQLTALSMESDGAESDDAGRASSAGHLIDRIDEVLDAVLEEIRRTPDDRLTAVRHVGRARVPSTVIGLLFHIAEHTQRHTGQVVTTVKIVRGGG